MVQKRKVDWNEYQGLVAKICRDISISGWRPDYIVGITRGGLLPAKMISYYFDVPCETLKVSLRDHTQTESNTWMAEDAFGYPRAEKFIEDENDVESILEAASELLSTGDNCKNILIVDDINDTGATLNWIMEDWQSSCLPNDPIWNSDVWNVNVKFAVLFDNLASECNVKMDYVGEEVNKAENNIWIDFPYEDWWTK
jgi:hypoxanthine phosphoribosyltransferase